jgi:hypothetical protein
MLTEIWVEPRSLQGACKAKIIKKIGARYGRLALTVPDTAAAIPGTISPEEKSITPSIHQPERLAWQM